MNANWKLYEFDSARLILYLVFGLNNLFFLFFKPFETLCDKGYHCPMCGMRTAVYYLFHGNCDFAILSNANITIALFIVMLIAFDIIQIIIRRL